MKYYVTSHDLRVVIAGPHIERPMDAVCEAMLTHLNENMKLSPMTLVSERGFDVFEHDDDWFVDTVTALKKAGFKVK